MKLHTDPGNFQALKLLVSANFSKVELAINTVKNTEHVVPYLSSGRLPALEVAPQKFLFSANAGARLLHTQTVAEDNESAVDHWLDWESACLLPEVFPFLVSSCGHGKQDEELVQGVKGLLKHLDSQLNGKQTLTGEQVTTADISVWSTLYPVCTGKTALKGWDGDFPAVLTWFSKLSSQLEFQRAVETLFAGGDVAAALKSSLTNQTAPLRTQESKAKPQPVQKQTSKKDDTQATAEKVIASPEEVAQALEAWKNGQSICPQPMPRVHPVLPESGRRNILITSALPYVNNVPHLGNIIGCVLSADVFSRYCRLRNYNSVYICGTDEYGTATETKAIAEGVTPQQICDKYSAIHRSIYEWFNIDFDHFGRTTTKQQTEIAQDIFWRLQKRGYVLHDTIEQLHCSACDRFLADRFVEGTCPMCAFDDARGDQCDACGKLINAIDLIKPRCKLCKKPPAVKSTDHLFLDLPKLEPELQKHLDKVYKSGTWSNNARVITNSWIRDGLKPRCISRDLKWGTPVPLDGYTEKVFYVWFDAPIGYISITANYTSEWERWWKNPGEVEMYNFLGKDNVPFHSVIFPISLLGACDNYTVVNHMCATEYLNYEDTKFSKSRGTGVFGDQARDTGIPADVYRFYLLYVRPESQDSSFSWDDFLLKNNSELLNNLGNFINRALMFVSNNFGGTIQEMTLTEDDSNLLALVNRELRTYIDNMEDAKIWLSNLQALVNYELRTYIDNMEDAKIRDSIRNILNISRLGNQFMQENKPWVLVKGSDADKCRAGTVVSLAANVACLLSTLLQPYMPQVSGTLQDQLQAPPTCNVVYKDFVCHLPPGHKIGKPSPLFQKIEASTIADLRKRFAGTDSGKPKDSGKKKGGKPDGAPAAVADPAEAERLTAAIAEQGNKVRELKTAKAAKSLVDAEVAILLDLKKKLTLAQGVDSTAPAPGKKGGNKKKGAEANPNSAPPAPAAAADPVEAERLTAAVAEQGNKVRELKTAKAEKSLVDAEVAILLDLKKKLTLAQGVDPAAAAPGKKGGNKKKGAEAKPNSAPPAPAAGAGGAGAAVDSAEVERLTTAVNEQGNKVRELKTAKAEKSAVDAEVAALLDLKKKLALAQGVDPAAAAGGGKKKGKKK